MLRFFNKKLIALLVFFTIFEITAITTLNKSDPMPIYTTLDPNEFLNTQKKENLKHRSSFDIRERLKFFLSPFIQTGSEGKDRCNNDCNLGDILGKAWGPTQDGHGGWSILAMCFGDPQNGNPDPYPYEILEEIRNMQYYSNGDQDGLEIKNPIGYADIYDEEQKFGFFTVPLKYRKYGIRFGINFRLIDGIGIYAKTGLVNIQQKCLNFVDLTSNSTYSDNNNDLIHKKLMEKIEAIAKETGQDINRYSKYGFEDIHLGLFISHPFEGNTYKRSNEWAHFLFVPFIVLEGTVASANQKDLNKIFAAPLGNNGHHSIGGRTGFDFEFFETMQAGIELGGLYFFKKTFQNYRIPSNPYQGAIYPFAAGEVEIKPGHNYNFGFKLAARHFIDRLSTWVQYNYINHKKDKVTVLKYPDIKNITFFPEELEDISDWSVHLINAAFNYDISENTGVGIFVQLPFKGNNIYKAWTWIASLNIVF